MRARRPRPYRSRQSPRCLREFGGDGAPGGAGSDAFGRHSRANRYRGPRGCAGSPAHRRRGRRGAGHRGRAGCAGASRDRRWVGVSPVRGVDHGLPPGIGLVGRALRPGGAGCGDADVALSSTRIEDNRWRGLLGALAAVVVVWGIAALHAGISPTTAVVGYRSELRWVPLALVVALTHDHAGDTRWYGRAVVAAATIQSVIAVSEWIGGAPVSAFFSPDYSIVIGGLSVSSASQHVHSIFGTFENHNAFATYLVFAWVVLVALGWRRLGIRRDVQLMLAVLIPFVIVITGSREAAFALVAAALIVGRSPISTAEPSSGDPLGRSRVGSGYGVHDDDDARQGDAGTARNALGGDLQSGDVLVDQRARTSGSAYSSRSLDLRPVTRHWSDTGSAASLTRGRYPTARIRSTGSPQGLRRSGFATSSTATGVFWPWRRAFSALRRLSSCSRPSGASGCDPPTSPPAWWCIASSAVWSCWDSSSASCKTRRRRSFGGCSSAWPSLRAHSLPKRLGVNRLRLWKLPQRFPTCRRFAAAGIPSRSARI